MPSAEAHAVQWLRANANWDDLVLTTQDSAPWLAMAPVHSFASHGLCSLETKYRNHFALRNSFFAGTLTPAQARELLDTLGVRFVVLFRVLVRRSNI